MTNLEKIYKDLISEMDKHEYRDSYYHHLEDALHHLEEAVARESVINDTEDEREGAKYRNNYYKQHALTAKDLGVK